jgi:hypothetical protein
MTTTEKGHGQSEMGMRPLALVLLAIAVAGPALAAPADDRFREANDLVRTGDYPKAIALYDELAASGQESPAPRVVDRLVEPASTDQATLQKVSRVTSCSVRGGRTPVMVPKPLRRTRFPLSS